MNIEQLDHLVLTVADVEASTTFYGRVLGMEPVTFGEGRRALAFGNQKINLHPATQPFEPHAGTLAPGSADLCLLAGVSIPDVLDHLRRCGVAVEAGPVRRTGARGAMTSIYIRDPDGNLIELSRYR